MHLETLWAEADARACGELKILSLNKHWVSRLSFQVGSGAVDEFTELMLVKGNTKSERRKEPRAGLYFIWVRPSLLLNIYAIFPLKMQLLGWCENLCQKMPSREQNMYQVIMDVITGSNICLSFFLSHWTIVNFNMCVRFPAIYIKWNSLGKRTHECPYDFMLQPHLRSKANVSFLYFLLGRCQQNMPLQNKYVPATGIFDGPGCASALRNHPLLWSQGKKSHLLRQA